MSPSQQIPLDWSSTSTRGLAPQSGVIRVDAGLIDFIDHEVLPGLELDRDEFWRGFGKFLIEFTPQNKDLLRRRQWLQTQIDSWHEEHRGGVFDFEAYERFLKDIGYLVPPGPDFVINPTNIDAEIAEIAAPQLVVPITKARYALNAANARWGSLYDALYATDAILPPRTPSAYDPDRGEKIIAFARKFLDFCAPLERGSWSEATGFAIENGLRIACDGDVCGLKNPSNFTGYMGSRENPSSLFLKHHGLHIEIILDKNDAIGRQDRAGVADVVLEAALTVIQDCEDSVACVDAVDKIHAWRNWLGLMKGDLVAAFEKDGAQQMRALNVDRLIQTPDGAELAIPGRALLLVRIVGHHMTSDAVHVNGEEAPEGLLDAMITTLIALHDLSRTNERRNSRNGSIYIVKPKMHGPEEAAFAATVFDAVEDILHLPRHTIKIGLMDEERRTSVNLKQCIRAVKDRIFFINTGFLDRTGDEIHTSMEAGPMVRKSDMRQQKWIAAYEEGNVDAGLCAEFPGRAQIGKGMWAAPDCMADMIAQKQAQLEAGAVTAWAPSPTAATLHALHYHWIDARAVQKKLSGRAPALLKNLLTPPLAFDRMQGGRSWSQEEILDELENNAQSILGYVVRWIDQGVGCSKTPDIHNIALMEDRATLRISSQHIANWLHHGVCTREQVWSALEKMAAIVDRQNANDPLYEPMAPRFDGAAFQAACDLVFKGREQPSGYTELILRARRLEKKLLAQDRPT